MVVSSSTRPIYQMTRNKVTAITCANTFCLELFKVIVLLNFHKILSHPAGVLAHHAADATATPLQQAKAGDPGPATSCQGRIRIDIFPRLLKTGNH
jgi:hypothetical protein